MNLEPRPRATRRSLGAASFLSLLCVLLLWTALPAPAQEGDDAVSERERARQARIEEYLLKKEQRRAAREARQAEKAVRKNGDAPAAAEAGAVATTGERPGGDDLPRELARVQQMIRDSSIGQDPTVQRYLDLIDRQEASPHELAAFGSFISNNGMHREALEYYAIALGLERDDPTLWINTGTLQRKLGEFGKALRSYQQALRIEPNNAFAHYNVGAVLEQQGKYDAAVEAYTAALTLDPSLGDPTLNPAATNNELLLAVRIKLYQQDAGSAGLPLLEIERP